MANILTCVSLAATRSRSFGYSAYRSTSVYAADKRVVSGTVQQDVNGLLPNAMPATHTMAGRLSCNSGDQLSLVKVDWLTQLRSAGTRAAGWKTSAGC